MSKKFYKRCMGEELNLDNPSDLNQKVRWLILYSDTSTWPRLADKYMVREYIKECGYEDMLVKLYGVWKKPSQISFDKLPDKFVLKLNNGSGDVIIVNDKSQVDEKTVVAKLNKHLKSHFGANSVEPHYLKIPPRVIAEELLVQDGGISSSLIDYKFLCFYGKPECVLVCYDRNKQDTNKVVYDMDWNMKLDYTNVHPTTVIKDIPRPVSFSRMIEACKVFGKPYPFLRIDFYEVNGKPYFGELTFTPAAGTSHSFNQEYMNHLGDKIDIGKLSK